MDKLINIICFIGTVMYFIMCYVAIINNRINWITTFFIFGCILLSGIISGNDTIKTKKKVAD